MFPAEGSDTLLPDEQVQGAWVDVIDAAEARAEGLVDAWALAAHFRVPHEMVRLQAPFVSASTAALRRATRPRRSGASDA